MRYLTFHYHKGIIYYKFGYEFLNPVLNYLVSIDKNFTQDKLKIGMKNKIVYYLYRQNQDNFYLILDTKDDEHYNIPLSDLKEFTDEY